MIMANVNHLIESNRVLTILLESIKEDSKGRWRLILDYDNYHDGARILDGDENILAECYDINIEDSNEQFRIAINNINKEKE